MNIFNTIMISEVVSTKYHGLSPKAQRSVREKHKGLCNICGVHESEFTRRHAIDHCHKTGVIRGVLCAPCNRGIGSFGDDPSRLEQAANYLRRTRDGSVN